jgi:hypothetical protein
VRWRFAGGGTNARRENGLVFHLGQDNAALKHRYVGYLGRTDALCQFGSSGRVCLHGFGFQLAEPSIRGRLEIELFDRRQCGER